MSRMPDNYDEAEAWARDRIGKRVYRHALSCKCDVCARVVDDGLVITDKYHAGYITDYAMELGYRYADSPEELEAMKQTFLQYMFSRTGFGKTPWPLFAIIMGLSLAMLGFATFMDMDGSGAKGVCYLFGFGVPALLLWGTWKNYKGDWV